MRHLAERGYGIGDIARRVLGHEELPIFCLSFGDVSKRNVVRSILHGPVPRRDAVMTQPLPAAPRLSESAEGALAPPDHAT
ncbi:MAG: hypothetical protein U0166_02145 [Acidobacteriota bacterium]